MHVVDSEDLSVFVVGEAVTVTVTVAHTGVVVVVTAVNGVSTGVLVVADGW